MHQDTISSSPVQTSTSSMPPKSSSSGRDAQLEALLTRQAALESTVSQLLSQRTVLVDSLSSFSSSSSSSCRSSDTHEPRDAEERARIAVDNASARIKSQIKQLSQYNDIKDIGTQLMGLIAEKRGCRIAEVQEEFAINPDD
jgi:hypothetical protein